MLFFHTSCSNYFYNLCEIHVRGLYTHSLNVYTLYKPTYIHDLIRPSLISDVQYSCIYFGIIHDRYSTPDILYIVRFFLMVFLNYSLTSILGATVDLHS